NKNLQKSKDFNSKKITKVAEMMETHVKYLLHYLNIVT
ncbi:KH homology domain-containing protein 4, partial [Caerostris darwini]